MIQRLTINLCILLLLFFSTASESQASKDLTKEGANHLLASGKFKPVSSKKDIPKLWWPTMNLEGVSDIGGAFSAGCTGNEPHRRLLLASVSEPYALSLTEQGGIAYFVEFKIYKHEENSFRQIYFEQVREPRIKEIRQKLGVK